MQNDSRMGGYELWLDEIENFSARWERLHWDFPDLNGQERERLDQWLRAAYVAGYEYNNTGETE